MQPAAVIFDVDGVLLELTSDEEELFFEALSRYVPTAALSRDWNTYKIRNDEDIIAEILEQFGLALSIAAKVRDEYLALLERASASGAIKTIAIQGAAEILTTLPAGIAHGIATANFREAARIRLTSVGLWQNVSHLAFGADGGGHKHQILGRALAHINLPAHRIVYIGDNVNDVEAGHRNSVHFIGFSCDPDRLKVLASAGATHLSSDHQQTARLIRQFLGA